MHNLLRKIFGWHNYSVVVTYKDKAGRIVFSYTRTIGVARKKFINDGRKIKTALGTLYSQDFIPNGLLCNGILEINPVCYLGRWR